MLYKGGVLTRSCGTHLNHAVLIVDTNIQDYMSTEGRQVSKTGTLSVVGGPIISVVIKVPSVLDLTSYQFTYELLNRIRH